jgi:OOP family OmpA-OmpF porin
MADDHSKPPAQDAGSEISDHVNEYLTGLRARFDELTDRIEEASRTSLNRSRAELEQMMAGEARTATETPADGDSDGEQPPAREEAGSRESDGPGAEIPFGSERLAARLRELEEAEAAAAAANIDVPPGSERLAARLRELEAAEAAAAAAVADIDVPAGSERLAARLRELEAAEAAAAEAAEVAAPGIEIPAPPGSISERIRRLEAEAAAAQTVAPTVPPGDPAHREPEVEQPEPDRVPASPPAPPTSKTERRGGRRLTGMLAVLVLLAGAFVAGWWWSTSDATSVAPPSTLATQTTIATTPADNAIRSGVEASMAGLDVADVTVDATDGVVLLTGSVPDTDTRNAVSAAVSTIEGVRQIDNRIQIVPATPPTPEQVQAAADAVRTETGFGNLDVTVEDGVATITGVVAVDTVSTGVFGSIAPLREALIEINGIDAIVTRVQLRGDEVAMRAELRALVDETPIIFDSASAELAAESVAVLDRAAEIIVSYPGLRVLIAGHTDAAGATEQNEALAAARGQAVLGYLISRGVPVTRLQVVSYGELFPEAGGEQSLNRRIEFEVAP